ncbi:MAG: tetratricopeptide repeat protein [Cyclobacteriaceae bacterium]|jgi:tetratricopeptide (TPR) repeat protein|nr:tetratricopeptide repeat protein [Cyclobacteriaceae bacterium]
MRVIFLLLVLGLITPMALAQGKKDKIKAAEVLGDTLMSRQDFVGALKQYNKVAKATKLKTPEDRQMLYKRGLCYFYLTDYYKALNDLNTFITDNPRLYRARILRAFIYRELEDLDKQLADLDEVLGSEPFNIDLLKWRAGILVESGDHRRALKELKSIQLMENDEEIELYLGLSYYNLEERDSALMHFDAAIALNGGFVPAYLYASSVALEEEAYTLALSYINLGLMLDSQNMQLIFYKGIALVNTDKKDEGCRLLNKAFYGGLDDAGDYLVEYCYPKED